MVGLETTIMGEGKVDGVSEGFDDEVKMSKSWRKRMEKIRR